MQGVAIATGSGMGYAPLLKPSMMYLNNLLESFLMIDRAAKTALFDEFARVGKALGSGRRIELLDVLANGERTVEGLAGEVGLSVANTSQHLQVLRQAGLITGHRQGTSIRYRLHPQATRRLAALLSSLIPADTQPVATS